MITLKLDFTDVFERRSLYNNHKVLSCHLTNNNVTSFCLRIGPSKIWIHLIHKVLSCHLTNNNVTSLFKNRTIQNMDTFDKMMYKIMKKEERSLR